MSSAGKMLREERLSQNRTLADIAGETCITSRYLEAIENDDPKIVPGDFFYRSFIRQYASALKLDEETTHIILRQAVPLKEVDPLPAFAMAYKTAKTEGGLSGLYRPRTAVALALLGTVLLGCSGLYAIWRNAQVERETSLENTPAPAAAQASPEVQPAVPLDPDAGRIPSEPATEKASLPDAPPNASR